VRAYQQMRDIIVRLRALHVGIRRPAVWLQSFLIEVHRKILFDMPTNALLAPLMCTEEMEHLRLLAARLPTRATDVLDGLDELAALYAQLK